MDLLASIGLVPQRIVPAEIDETPQKNEPPLPYARRMAMEKARAIAQYYPENTVLAADTVVACGRRILPKAEDPETARACMELLSGRRHRVYTAVALCDAQGRLRGKDVMTVVTFQRLRQETIDWYLATGEWHGKAGGYAIQGAATAFVSRINGSYSNVVGLPLAETRALLEGRGRSLTS